MVQHFILPIPMALAWVALTDHPTLEGFAIGYVIAFGLALVLTRNRHFSFNITELPVQIISSVIYTIRLSVDVLVSGVEVALRAFGFLPVRNGIIAVPIQYGDEADDLVREVIAGLSAHSITITPGELVVEYNADRTIMYVHTLDAEASAKTLDAAQARRVATFKRILGRD